MKQFLSLTTIILLFINLHQANAQFIAVSPNSSDFCSQTNVTYTVPAPAVGNTNEWWFEDYSNFNSGGASLFWMIGTGTSKQIFSGSFGAM